MMIKSISEEIVGCAEEENIVFSALRTQWNFILYIIVYTIRD